MVRDASVLLKVNQTLFERYQNCIDKSFKKEKEAPLEGTRAKVPPDPMLSDVTEVN